MAEVGAIAELLETASDRAKAAEDAVVRGRAHARQVEQSLGRKGLRKLAYRMGDVVTGLGRVGQALVAERATLTESACQVAAVPAEAAAEQVIAALGPVAKHLADVPARVQATSAKVDGLQAEVAATLRGATPGPLLARLEQIKAPLPEVVASVAAAVQRTHEMIAAARAAGGIGGGAGSPVSAGVTGAASGGVPRRQHPERPDSMPEPVWRRICDGNQFNWDDQVNYDLNEIRLTTGKVMDSYVHEEEIIERKHTQLAEVQPATAIGYLRSARLKYRRGKRIADSPRNRELCPELVGERTKGKLVLKVPVQKAPVPDLVLAEARRLKIEIRDTEGRSYR